MTLSAERQCTRMSKITNDGLTRSGRICFIAVTYGNSGRQIVKLTEMWSFHFSVLLVKMAAFRCTNDSTRPVICDIPVYKWTCRISVQNAVLRSVTSALIQCLSNPGAAITRVRQTTKRGTACLHRRKEDKYSVLEGSEACRLRNFLHILYINCVN